MRRCGLAAATFVAACAAAASTAHAVPPLRAVGEDGPLGNERLSDERTVSRWAYAAEPSSVRARPTLGAHVVSRLRWSTENGLPEVYLVLASRRDDTGRAWLHIRIPGRPNGRTGWVGEESLTALRTVTTQLLVRLDRLTATLRRRGRPILTAPIGIGAPGTNTPRGRFWIRERLRNLAGSPIYGPWAFSTAAYSMSLTDWPRGGVVGIHGTNQPELIPGRPSHGCIRVPNTKIRVLARLMPIGTPVRIR